MVGKNFEEIMDFHQKRREHILKGFVDFQKNDLISLDKLTSQLGSENVYTFKLLKGYTEELIQKGTEEERLNFKETLNSLVCIPVDNNGSVIDVFIEKGHMDFASNFDGSSRGLVKKQITDKRGRQTTKWVKKNSKENEEDSSAGNESEKDDFENPGNTKEQIKERGQFQEDNSNKDEGDNFNQENQSGVKSPEDWVKETSDEDLKRFIDTADDSEIELIELAENELFERGVIGPGAEGSEDDYSEDELDSEVDYNNPESVKFALESHPDKDAIIDMAIDMGISIGQAMKVHNSNQQDHSETHAAIDQAQESLNALKEKTGHPETSGKFSKKNKKQLLKEYGNNLRKYESDFIEDAIAGRDESDISLEEWNKIYQERDELYDFMHSKESAEQEDEYDYSNLGYDEDEDDFDEDEDDFDEDEEEEELMIDKKEAKSFAKHIKQNSTGSDYSLASEDLDALKDLISRLDGYDDLNDTDLKFIQQLM
jgi:hypothetical protein